MRMARTSALRVMLDGEAALFVTGDAIERRTEAASSISLPQDGDWIDLRRSPYGYEQRHARAD